MRNTVPENGDGSPSAPPDRVRTRARRFFSRRPHSIPCIIAAAMLLLALRKWPYDYYRLLRFVTCAVAVLVAYCAYAWRKWWAAWLFGFVAVLFNPLLPIHLKRQTWQVIDPAAAALFLVAAILLAKPTDAEPGETADGEHSGEDAQSRTNMLMWGLLLVLGGCCFWYSLVGNPLHELALIRRARTATGSLVETHEEEVETEYPRHIAWVDVGVYTYCLPDGREFKTCTRAPPGELEEEPTIEYLPGNPSVSRIKGTGCQSIGEWLWRKVGLGTLLLALFVSPGIVFLRAGFRRRKGGGANSAELSGEARARARLEKAKKAIPEALGRPR